MTNMEQDANTEARHGNREALEAMTRRVAELEAALTLLYAVLSAERTRSGGQPFSGTWNFPTLGKRCTVLEAEKIARAALSDTPEVT